MSRSRTFATFVAAALAVPCFGAVLIEGHRLRAEWQLTHDPTPTFVQYADCDYRRSELPPTASVGGLKPRGHTPGGGTVYASGSTTPLTLVVVDGERHVEYGLLGGP